MWVLIPLSIALAAALVLKGGVWPREWNWIALAIALVTCAWWATPSAQRHRTRRLGVVETLALALGIYPLLQLLPLPSALVAILSPERYAAATSIATAFGEPLPAFIPLSLSTPRTFEVWLTLAPAIAVFFVMRQLLAQRPDSRWTLAAPIIALASLEALLGLAQWWLGRAADGNATATGTYVNRNHFAGLLEMATPLALCAAAACWQESVTRYSRPAAAGLKSALMLALGTLMLLAVVFSLSRMGFLAVIVGLALTASLAVVSKPPSKPAGAGWRRIVPALGAGACVLALALVLPTEALVARFSIFASGELSPSSRSQIWRDTLPLISAYPWTGCGLGAYEFGLYKWKTAAPMNTVDFAHNDYLQVLAELGIPGFLLAAALAALIFRRIGRAVLEGRQRPDWWLAAGLLAALVSIALHSLTDFNLYIPANLLTAAWLAGLASSDGWSYR